MDTPESSAPVKLGETLMITSDELASIVSLAGEGAIARDTLGKIVTPPTVWECPANEEVSTAGSP